ncbi:hypothetical protein KVV02_006899 [Mortierella alpina]|uniref:Oligopeptide transporter n=1 Tax=Mortierella alpina TaxID=64518 RepID=A0A9P8A6A6_MORAP|nr:hypothetical protein KVV02_006899 [Mortierella alpina]
MYTGDGTLEDHGAEMTPMVELNQSSAPVPEVATTYSLSSEATSSSSGSSANDRPLIGSVDEKKTGVREDSEGGEGIRSSTSDSEDEVTDDVLKDENGREISPIDEVAAVVPNTDDPTLPCMTFRFWVMGLASIFSLSFINQKKHETCARAMRVQTATTFTHTTHILASFCIPILLWHTGGMHSSCSFFRESPMVVGALVVQLISYPAGQFMARVLPSMKYRLFGFSFSLNPGPFNVKEHVLITIMASCGAGTAYAVDIIVIQRVFYEQDFGFVANLLLILTTQMLGYGMAGILRRYLVYPAAMIWPANLWGVIAPERMFGPSSIYHPLMYFFVFGLFIPIPFYIVSRWYPGTFIDRIHTPVILTSTGIMPPARPYQYANWLVVGFMFQFWAKRYRRDWYHRFNYVLSAALDSGVALAALLIFFTLQMRNVEFPAWWGTDMNHCPLENANFFGVVPSKRPMPVPPTP